MFGPFGLELVPNESLCVFVQTNRCSRNKLTVLHKNLAIAIALKRWIVSGGRMERTGVREELSE